MTRLPETGVSQRQRSASHGPAVLVVGAGIGGLTTALELHRAGIGCRVVESATAFAPAGVGINILPHAARLLGELGLEAELSRRAVLTRESVFYNRFGQFIYAEPAGRAAGYPDPQYSIHRADLHEVLLGAVAERLGAGAVATGHRVTRVDRDWVAELETPQRADRDWTQRGELEDFLPCFAPWRFDWLDVPALLRASAVLLEYPMVDAEPLPRWSHGRVTLLGDAAHPMVPRGSNGAGQAILDARAVADALAASPGDPVAALTAYEDRRREATAAVVLANRQNPPDAILREVYERTGDRPFERLEDYVTVAELARITENYQRVAGFTVGELRRPRGAPAAGTARLPPRAP
jgi:2-polyprenyl-6-methoxyphenol hydroxylase-like FAD-dependent oxidoreductase